MFLLTLPDIVHIAKCIHCSLSNWLLVIDNCRIHLSMIRILREQTDTIGRLIRKEIDLDSVRKRDRQNSDEIRQASATSIRSMFPCKKYCNPCVDLPDNNRCARCLSHSSTFCDVCVIDPLVPEKWRLSETNKEGCIKRPHAICNGPPSMLFVANDKTIYSMRLHYPVEIQVVSSQENEKFGFLAYINGVILYSKLKAKCVCFRDITGCLVPKLPTRKGELREFLEKRNIVYSRNNNVKQLKE